MIALVNANSLHIPLADQSVHMVVTSPPYWSLRDYQVAGQLGLEPVHDCLGWATGQPCGKCYVCHMVQVFGEVKRILRDDGACFLNLGDSYANNPGNGRGGEDPDGGIPHRSGRNKQVAGLKTKDLCMIPARIALALQADGWYLRSDIAWIKKAPMPESVTDRPTSAWEHVFLLAKSEHYFYDIEATKEKSVTPGDNRAARTDNTQTGGRNGDESRKKTGNPTGEFRNMRNYIVLGPDPCNYSHFATYPRALVEPCIKAGTSERGCCPICGAPWERVTEPNSGGTTGKSWHPHVDDLVRGNCKQHSGKEFSETYRPGKTTGWRPTCSHAAPVVPCTVLDPFAGSGTTGIVARALGRNFIGLDLSFPYLSTIARKRLSMDALEEWTEGIQVENPDGFHDLPLFQVNP